ncbi:MAG: hypothetical protein KDK36_17240 [Leptospiraceae bacterium]|nr:hypothetical protein [Leptospiraceae bacterium]
MILFALIFAGAALAIITVGFNLIAFYILYRFKLKELNIHLKRALPFIVSIIMGFLYFFIGLSNDKSVSETAHPVLVAMIVNVSFILVFYLLFLFLIFIRNLGRKSK